MKKIIAAHDISGLGKASLGSALPIISVMGSVVCCLPTAVLSTITGVYEGYSITDLTEQMKDTIAHWKNLNTNFDMIYSGFLANSGQVDIIINAAKSFNNCYFVADPVFADNGQLYQTMNLDMVKSMRRLISSANIITPNFTEACFLLGETMDKTSEQSAKQWLRKLNNMGPERVVITSFPFGDEMFIVAYDKKSDAFWKLKYKHIPVDFHGTGDVFTSVLCGAFARGDSFESAITLAADFAKNTINATINEDWDLRQGLLIEKRLTTLANVVKSKCERF
ncbi:MAG: pyridoxamine kinase [Firmicutes bacterium]|nr:pyridoxamine kinase [Bacillota bacterium]